MSKRRRNQDDFDLGLDDQFDMGGGQVRASRGGQRRGGPPRREGDKTMAYTLVILLLVAIGAGFYFDVHKLILGDGSPDPKVTKKPPPKTNQSGFGRIKLVSNPKGATVYLEDTSVGTTPYESDRLKTGTYNVRVELKGHLPWKKTIEVKAGGLAEEAIALKEEKYKLSVTVVPEYASVRILNIKEKFKQGMLLPPGTYKVNISSPGFRTVNKSVVVFGQDQEVAVELKPRKITNRLLVKVSPEQAQSLVSVFVLESDKSYSDKGIKLGPGEYNVQIEAEGYHPQRKKIRIGAKPKTLKVKLKPKNGGVKFTVDTEPKNAKVEILNISEKYKDNMRLPPGKYQVKVSARNFRSVTEWVTLTKDQKLSYKLKDDSYHIIANVEPAYAEVRITKPKKLKYSAKKKYRPGNYELEIRAKGYASVTKKIELKDNDRIFEVKLKKAIYTLTINTNPKNARIRILGRKAKYKRGMTVKPGKYQIQVSAKGYKPKKRTITIKDKSVTETISLKEDKYALTIITDPPTAVVEIKEPKIKYKPGIKLAPGNYQVTISSPGLKQQVSTVAITNKDVKLNVKLGEESYRLTVKTTPANAKIKILDYPEEYTPGMRMIPGRYQLEATVEGYAPVKQWVTIIDKDENVFILLKHKTYKLEVQVEPKDAKIEIVDYPKEYDNGIQLPPGNYQVRASRKNRRTTTQMVAITNRDVILKMRMGWRKVLKPDKPFEPVMIVMPKTSYKIGSPDSEEGHKRNEGPVTTISFAKAFAIGKYEVTFAQYDQFASATGRAKPSDNGWGRGRRPVINVSQLDAEAFAQWLSDKTGKKYRLPSEAEWEYAARAGTRTPFFTGKCITTKQANYDGDYRYGSCPKGVNRGKTMPVGSFPANQFGLHDTAGNVWEWMADCWKGSHNTTPRNGGIRVRGDCSDPVIRGGAWDSIPKNVRSAKRDNASRKGKKKNIGFRLVRELR